MWRLIVALLLSSAALLAKDNPTITLKVVNTYQWDQARSVMLPGTGSQSNTNCSILDTSANCTTETTPGMPARTYVRNIHQVDVHVVMPDGSRAIIWCQQKWRYCTELRPGDYKAEVNKGVAWVYVTVPTENPKYTRDGTLLPRKTKLEKVKYQIVASYDIEPAVTAARAKYPDIFVLGRDLGYSDHEIAEAINVEGADQTRDFLRREKEKKK